MIHVVLVEDHTMVRQLFSQAVCADLGFQLDAAVGTASAGRMACLEHKPDLAIIDYMLPDASGIDLIRQLRPLLPRTRFIMVTSSDYLHVVKEAADLGVQGFVLKSSPLEILSDAIQAVLRGQTYYCDDSSRILADAEPAAAAKADDRLLTAREREILRAVASGLGTKEIAVQLNVSAKTVANHLVVLKEKLGIHETAGLVRYAIKAGLVNPP